jgi:hypothetical protein
VTGLVLFVREGCHLCDEFALGLALDLGIAFEDVTMVDVDSRADLAARYGLRVPVLENDGKLLCEGRYDSSEVRRRLRL